MITESDAYKEEVTDTRETLKEVRSELKQVQEALRKKKIALKNLKQEIHKERFQQESLRLDKKLPSIEEDLIFPKALEEVEIYTKDNKVAMAKPCKRLFDEELYLQYRSLLRENKLLKSRLSRKDFEISVLKIELRDMHKEAKLYQDHNLLKDK
ncbi:nickel-binding protein Mua [Helicobacter cetorum]|uniref:nickel-binding protein Mua n=1 Tax=Helicobacter cetorum TaxID=138563 RepID=UPI00117DE5BC|nr:nickel-binding protein Mua [Helicobacter cetorum]